MASPSSLTSHRLQNPGDMMYLHPPSLIKYRKDLAGFIDND